MRVAERMEGIPFTVFSGAGAVGRRGRKACGAVRVFEARMTFAIFS